MSKFIKYIHTIPVGTAEGLVAQAYSQIKREMAGVPEPFLIHSPSPTLLAGVWSMFRESLVAGQVRRGLKEVAAATISQINQCPWCVEAHTLALHATGDHADHFALDQAAVQLSRLGAERLSRLWSVDAEVAYLPSIGEQHRVAVEDPCHPQLRAVCGARRGRRARENEQ